MNIPSIFCAEIVAPSRSRHLGLFGERNLRRGKYSPGYGERGAGRRQKIEGSFVLSPGCARQIIQDHDRSFSAQKIEGLFTVYLFSFTFIKLIFYFFITSQSQCYSKQRPRHIFYLFPRFYQNKSTAMVL